MDTVKALQTVALFKDLKEAEDLSAFAAIAIEERFTPEQVVYSAGSAGDSLYAIIEGDFVVRVADDEGDEVDVAVIKTGSYFGEMEVIGGFGRTAAVVSRGDGRCLRFDAADLKNLLQQNDRLAAHFYREVCGELIHRLKSTTRDMGYFKARAL